MVRRFIGLDVHKRVVEACGVDRAGRIVFRKRFGCSRVELLAFGKGELRRSDRIALEATTNTWAVAGVLRPFVEKVIVSNPVKTRAIAEAKIKTDKVDSEVLAQLLRCDYLPSVWIPEPEVQDLRQLTGRRAALIVDRAVVKNRIVSALAQKLLVSPVTDLFTRRGFEWISSLSLDEQTRLLIDSDLRLFEGLTSQIERLDDVLFKRAFAEDKVKLLITLPGVDVAVAQSLLAAWGDMDRFKDPDHAASYLGLAPSTKQSADKCYHGPITKQGNRRARVMLVQAAQHLSTHPGPLGAFFRRLARKKPRNVVVVATARKLALIAWHMLHNNEPYRYALPGRTQMKLMRLRIRGGGIRRANRGIAPGSRRPASYGSGRRTRTLAPLPEIYQVEGLPKATPPECLPSGETRVLEKTGVRRYVLKLQEPKLVVTRDALRPPRPAR